MEAVATANVLSVEDMVASAECSERGPQLEELSSYGVV